MVCRSGMPAARSFALALVLGLGVAPLAQAAEISARVDGDLLTLQPNGAPLAEVLEAIGEAGDFTVSLRGSLAEPVQQGFDAVPLEDAIRALVGPHGLIVLRAAAQAGEIGAVNEVRVRARPGTVAAQGEAAPEAGEDALAVEDAAPGASGLSAREAYRQSMRDYVPPSRDELSMALSAPDTLDRVVAVPKVGALAPEAAIAVLGEALDEEQDPLVRSRAVAALTRLEGPAAQRMLRQRALEDADTDLRMQALNAMASSAGERSINVLTRALRQDPDPAVREAALRALGRVGGDWVRGYLARTAPDLDPALRSIAEEALAGQ